jgi:hypothetical protein
MIMAKTIGITISDQAHKQMKLIQNRLTYLRKQRNPAMSAANQADTLEWIIGGAPLP